MEKQIEEECKRNNGCGEIASNGFMVGYCGSKVNNFGEVYYCKKCKEERHSSH